MKSTTRHAVAVALVLGLAGCSTVPNSPGLRMVPPERVYVKTALSADTPATLRVVRDTGYLNSACELTVYLQGKVAASVADGETVDFFVPAGEVVLKVGRDHRGGALCGNTFDGSTDAIETVATSGKVKVLRVTTNWTRGLFLQRAD